MSARPKLVVGLGNPGREYDGTRHNIGFAVVDRLAEQHGCSFKRKWRFSAELAECTIGDGAVWLAKPRTYMNRSGGAVAALLHWLKAPITGLLVVVDDADLPLGQLRLRAAGGGGGHHGLESIIEALGGDEGFARVRVGIGRRVAAGEGLTGHVLSRFAGPERPLAEQAVETAGAAVETCVERGLAAAMNQFNRGKGERR